MMCDSGLCTNGKKWIKTRMKTPICFNSKGNEVITWCLLNIWSCFLLSSHHCYMCCHYQCLLHHIYANQINNDDICQGLKTISNDKDIHLLLGVVRKKVGDLPLNMCSILQINSCNNIPKCIMCCYMFIPERALEQMDT
jgi:hypothetical protein